MAWSGVNFGETSSVDVFAQGDVGKFFFGTFIAQTLTGETEGYGNTIEIFAGYNFTDKISLTIDDYFFFEPADSLNDYFNYSSNSTQHFLEAQLRYTPGNFEFLAAYSFWGGGFFEDNTNGVYLEAKYFVSDYVSVWAGYLTGESILNFHETSGFTNIGVEVAKGYEFGKDHSITVATGLVANPNYEAIYEIPRVGASALNGYFRIILQ